jgi:hypothetical protein
MMAMAGCSGTGAPSKIGQAERAAANLFVDPSSPSVQLGGSCAAQTPCVRINDALTRARYLRASGGAGHIHIHVAAGTYVGSYTPASAPSTQEDLPLLLNIPDVTLEGETVLGPVDGDGVPTCPDAGCHGTNITTNDVAVSGQSLILVAGTTDSPEVHDVAIRGLSVYYPAPSAGFPIYFDRVTNLRIEGNFVTNGTTGPFGRHSTVEAVGNVVFGGAPSFCATAGNATRPTRALVVHNRFEKSTVGGFLAGTTGPQFLLVSPALGLTLLPISAAEFGNVNSGAFLHNAMNNNDWAGMRLMQLTNQTTIPLPPDGDLNVAVIGNTFYNNGRTGLSFDSGFSQRRRPEALTGHLRAVVDGNLYGGNGSWPVSISFTRLDPVAQPNNLATWKFLQDSMYEFWDLDGELADAHIVNPPCDPFLSSCPPGPPLDNTLIVNTSVAPPPDLQALIDDASALL